MNTFSRTVQILSLTLFVGVALLVPNGKAFAVTPSVSSFTLSSQTVSSGYGMLASWSGSYTTGYDIYFSCPEGVTLAYQNGGTIACNSNVRVGDASATSVGFVVNNTSGTNKSVTVNVYPLDDSGVDYLLGGAGSSFIVNTMAVPLLSFDASPHVASSSNTITLSWSANPGLGGTNISYDCNANLQVRIISPFSSSTPACGTTLSPNPLGLSGPFLLAATNTNATRQYLTVRLWPGTSSGSYDGTHALSAVVAIEPPSITVVHPSIAYFTTSATTTSWNNAPFTLSWNANNTSGVNVQFQCTDGLTVSSVTTNGSATTTTKLPCGVVAFPSPLAASSSVTLAVSNLQPFAQTLAMSIWPMDENGVYNGIYGAPLSMGILPAGSSVSTQATSSATSTTPSATASIVTAVEVPTSKGDYVPHSPFTLTLTKGSHNTQVRLLQQFLALNPEIYPEGLVTGYYGAATGMAVKRFQDKYGIAHNGDAGYGTVGPKTRVVLNIAQTP